MGRHCMKPRVCLLTFTVYLKIWVVPGTWNMYLREAPDIRWSQAKTKALWASNDKTLGKKLPKALGAHITMLHTLDARHRSARFSICPVGFEGHSLIGSFFIIVSFTTTTTLGKSPPAPCPSIVEIGFFFFFFYFLFNRNYHLSHVSQGIWTSDFLNAELLRM